MAKVTTFALDGLQTDPGPFSAASDGALVEAHNVVCEREGLLEPRGPIRMSTDAALSSAYVIHHAHQSGTEPLRTWARSGGTWLMRRSGTTTITGPTTFTPGRINSALMKGRLLFTSEDGVCESPGSATVALRAGLPQPCTFQGLVTTGGSAGTWLGNNQSVAYRFVLVRIRPDGSEMVSPPSAPWIVRNTSGSSGGVTIIPLPGLAYTPWDVSNTYDALQAGDLLHVYRGPVLAAATGTPSDTMRLRASLVITPGGSPVVQEFVDKLSDSEWNGPELYTNSTRQGLANAHVRPGYARDVCSYNGMALYAGYKSPHRVAVTCKAIGDISADPQETLCSKTITVTTTSGSINLTAISAGDVKYMAPGQWITLSYGAGGIPGVGDARFTVDTQIATVNYAGGTATLSKTALATGAISVTVWDWVGVTSGVTTYRQFAQEAANTVIQQHMWRQAANGTGVIMGGYQDLEFHFNNSTTRIPDIRLYASGSDEVYGQPEYRNVLMQFERASLSSTAFTVKSSKPRAFSRPVDPVTGIASAQDGGDARLAISTLDIPDSVPTAQFVDIGDLSSPIYRVIVARSCALVIKGDGVYSVYGNSPSTMTVQLVDSTIAPPRYDIAANWVTRRGDSVYMMSSRGPVVLSDSFAQSFGGDINESLRETFGPGFDLANTFTSCTSGACPATPNVLFAFSTASASRIYVYNADADAWTTWSTRRPTSALWVSSNGAQGFGMGNVAGVYYDSRAAMGTPVTASSVNLTGDTFGLGVGVFATVTPLGSNRYSLVLSASNWTPEIGDVVVQSSTLGVVETVTSPTSIEVVANGALSTSTVAWYEGYPCRAVWTARTLGTIAQEKRNVGLSYAFALRQMLLRFTGFFQSSYAANAGVQTTSQPQILPGWTGTTAYAESVLAAPEIISVGVPRDVTLDWGLRVGFSIQQALSWFSLGAITIDAEDSGGRIGRYRG